MQAAAFCEVGRELFTVLFDELQFLSSLLILVLAFFFQNIQTFADVLAKIDL